MLFTAIHSTPLAGKHSSYTYEPGYYQNVYPTQLAVESLPTQENHRADHPRFILYPLVYSGFTRILVPRLPEHHIPEAEVWNKYGH